ncbi:hypothetical protein A8B82_12730 [Sulfitobacter sp. EhC04]|uniref:hypothetical protein n=1 Tax=Sulfitobacter sp. EhC04 TaxID=1849168 RepID=UPI0007F392CB|nr:hypothetical protein [Sulfitobacter sp. EhC04]OAN77764.1 hypothetical protein A8B82_12730 [Sulfitobacter sp. EhC04]
MEFVKAREHGWLESLSQYETPIQMGVLALVVVFLGWQAVRLWRKPRRSQACRWRKDGAKGGMRRWRCTQCGIDAFSQDRRPPTICKRGLREVGL